MFCENCGGLLLPSNGRLYCNECKLYYDMELTVGESTKQSKKILNEVEASASSITDARCGKCGNNKAYFEFKQMRSSDEAPTRFYKCTKCAHMWRVYD